MFSYLHFALSQTAILTSNSLLMWKEGRRRGRKEERKEGGRERGKEEGRGPVHALRAM